MEISNKPSKTLSRVNKLQAAGFILLSLLGFLDATYLTIKHFQGTIPPCSVAHGCETVLTSQYSTIGPVPVALYGAAYYLAILLGTFVYLDIKSDVLLKRLAQATILGLLASMYFFGLQWLVLKAWCQYCLASVATSTLLFIHGRVTLHKNKPIV